MRNTGLDEAQAGIKIAWRNINNLRYPDDTTPMAESEEELKSLLMKVKEESEKVGLKVNIQNTKIMASSPITLWQIDGQTVEKWQTSFFWAPESLQMVIAAMKLKETYSLEESYDQTRQHIKKLLLLLLSHFSRVRLCVTPQTAAHQALPSRGFSRQEHWSGLPFPSPMHESEVAQSYPTLSDPMDRIVPGSSVHRIFQARVLEPTLAGRLITTVPLGELWRKFLNLT